MHRGIYLVACSLRRPASHTPVPGSVSEHVHVQQRYEDGQ